MSKKIKIKRNSLTACYSGSLLQQNFGESINKGYIIWDTKNLEHSRRFILNDYGFCKIHISQGESIEDRVNNMEFSHDKKKTKVHVIIQDYEENYSAEKEFQIKQLIKDKHGCETVNVFFEEISKEKNKNLKEIIDNYDESDFLDLIYNFIKDNSASSSKEEIEDVISLSKEVDKALEINEEVRSPKHWKLDNIEISNIYSFPEKPSFVDFSKYEGVLGVFGENFSGKSNLVRALIFGLFQVELGKKGRSAGSLVNIYTKKNTGYVTIGITINDEKYKIHREVKTSIDKSGKISNSFPVKYSKFVLDSKTNSYEWKEEESDENTTENKEIKKQILNSIGSFDEFSKISLHLQSGEGDFMKEEQQPKNDLIRKFMGLDLFDERYDYANETFKEIKRKQKELGEIEDVSKLIKDIEEEIKNFEINIQTLSDDKVNLENNIEALELNKKDYQSKIQNLDLVEINSVEKLDENISFEKNNLELEIEKSKKINDWLSKNFKKELPDGANDNIIDIENNINGLLATFKEDKVKYLNIENWIKSNSKYDYIEDPNFIGLEISNLNKSLIEYNNQLSINKGENCPTCGSITKQANQFLIDKYTQLIKETSLSIKNLEARQSQIYEQQKHNNNYDINFYSLENLKNSLIVAKLKIEELKNKKSVIENSSEILKHNNIVQSNTIELSDLNNSILNRNKKIIDLSEMKKKVILNKDKQDKNDLIKLKISDIESDLYKTKISIKNIDSQINDFKIEKRLSEEKFHNLESKLNEIREAEKKYKKYSVYLQAVHRDGIPANIIRKKLPIINNKINSLLGEVVDFKVEIIVNKNGDLMEYFYFNEDKSDMLPVYAFSGSQGFLSALAVKVALQYASNFVKPSILIIDEGFGTLDKNIIHEFPRILDYLRPKFKNIIITTHISEVKDFVDHTIEISKTRTGVTKEGFEKHPKAWVTHMSLS